MQQSKVFYVRTTKQLDKNELNEMFQEVYDKFVNSDSIIYVNTDNRDKYSCWGYEESYFILDEYSFLWKLPSAFSPNDVAGNVNLLDKDSNPIVLDLNVNEDNHQSLEFKFSKIANIEHEANKFCRDILNYRDIHEGKIFFMQTKKEVKEFLEKYNIDVMKFNVKIWDKIEEVYLNPNFDKNSDIVLETVNNMISVKKESRDYHLS